MLQIFLEIEREELQRRGHFREIGQKLIASIPFSAVSYRSPVSSLS